MEFFFSLKIDREHIFFCNKMEQNLSLYEDALQFYLVILTDDGELSESMQFAREVCVFLRWFFFLTCIVFYDLPECFGANEI